MARTFTIFLSTAPYHSENTLTAVRIAEAALGKGHSVSLIASGDGVYCFLKNQKAKGILNAEEKFTELMSRGLKIYL